MAAAKKPKTPPLTPAEEEIARAEVTAYYDEEIEARAKVIDELEAKLEAARARRDKAYSARFWWLDSGQITEDGTPPADPDSRAYRNFVTQVALASGTRATRLAIPAIQARARGAADAEQQHDTARTAYDRAEILKRWMLAKGFPVTEF